MDPYAVLGVGRGATEEDVKAAYRRLALLWHPDRHMDAGATKVAEATKQFNQARPPLHVRHVLCAPCALRLWSCAAHKCTVLSHGACEVPHKQMRGQLATCLADTGALCARPLCPHMDTQTHTTI